MTLGLGEERRRRQSRGRTIRGIVLFGLFVAVLAFSYYLGAQQSAGEIEALNARIFELTDTNERLAKTKGEVEAALTQARGNYQQLETRYNREVPKGPALELQRMMSKKMEEGVTAPRIAAVVNLLQAKRVCEEGEGRRFYAKVPLYQGGGTEVALGGGLLKVSGVGQPVITAQNAPEAFYDPAKPIQVKLIAGDGTKDAEGVLPFSDTVIGAGYEWRVKLARGARGFVNVSFDRCKFP